MPHQPTVRPISMVIKRVINIDSRREAWNQPILLKKKKKTIIPQESIQVIRANFYFPIIELAHLWRPRPQVFIPPFSNFKKRSQLFSPFFRFFFSILPVDLLPATGLSRSINPSKRCRNVNNWRVSIEKGSKGGASPSARNLERMTIGSINDDGLARAPTLAKRNKFFSTFRKKREPRERTVIAVGFHLAFSESEFEHVITRDSLTNVRR